jgi:hypothetical protein
MNASLRSYQEAKQIVYYCEMTHFCNANAGR